MIRARQGHQHHGHLLEGISHGAGVAHEPAKRVVIATTPVVIVRSTRHRDLLPPAFSRSVHLPWLRAANGYRQSELDVLPHRLLVTCSLPASTADKANNKAEEIKGKAKETTGKAVGNERLEAEGAADQTKANVKQAGQQVKDAGKSLKP
jgi:uncharacterized protein YjbJ (UPF0337 family)